MGVATVGCASADTTPDANNGGAAGLIQGGMGGQVNGNGGFQQGNGGLGNGGFQQGNGGLGNGGFQQGNGGLGNGGFQQGNGGLGNGGFQQGNGGLGNGGFQQGNGGVQEAGGQQGTGGNQQSSAGPCITQPAQQGAILGDSYVTGFGSPALQSYLAADIQSIGQYPNYAGAGCSMASGGACTGLYGNVPAQATAANNAQANLEFVIMDGGGNDILICDAITYPGCAALCSAAGSSTNATCKAIVDKAMTTAKQLMTDNANAGVRDVVYFFYPHIPAKGSGNGGYDEILDYSEPLAKNLCDSAAANTGGKLRCHFVDLVEPFKAAGGDKNPANFAGDGIHPSAAGQTIIAKAVTDVMNAACLGQASGCCTQ